MEAEERGYWVLLSMAAGIGPVRFRRLLQVCGDARSAWHASDAALTTAGLERRTYQSLRDLRATSSPAAALERIHACGAQALTLLDADYPPLLRQIDDPPPVLFVRGTPTDQDQRAVAIVGTRRATHYGREVAQRLAAEIAAAGVTVVSGLARGIDTAAHRAAVLAGGRTIAVLGSGIDHVYPYQNVDLAEQIAQHGAVVSELPPGTPPDAVNFPRRNRIVAGLSRATIIVEAGARSGALITADFALEQGRDVYAVPGSILSPMSAGSNELLRQGAAPLTSAADVLDAYGWQARDNLARGVPKLGPREATVFQALGGDPRHVDELARELGRGAGDISATLTVLELQGLARHVGAMIYARA